MLYWSHNDNRILWQKGATVMLIHHQYTGLLVGILNRLTFFAFLFDSYFWNFVMWLWLYFLISLTFRLFFYIKPSFFTPNLKASVIYFRYKCMIFKVGLKVEHYRLIIACLLIFLVFIINDKIWMLEFICVFFITRASWI